MQGSTKIASPPPLLRSTVLGPTMPLLVPLRRRGGECATPYRMSEALLGSSIDDSLDTCGPPPPAFSVQQRLLTPSFAKCAHPHHFNRVYGRGAQEGQQLSEWVVSTDASGCGESVEEGPTRGGRMCVREALSRSLADAVLEGVIVQR